MKKKNNVYSILVWTGILFFFISAIAGNRHIMPDGGKGDNGTHNIDPRLVGKWMWTKASDGGYYSQSGVYGGAAYGFAIPYTVNADGTGSSYKHVQSTLGVGSGLVADISYQGFFEMNNKGRMGFFPTSGIYISSSGTNRKLRPNELWDIETGKGINYIYDKVNFTTQGGRACYQVTSAGGKVDTFFKQ